MTIVSKTMTENNENNVVRLSSSARSKMATTRKELIEMWTRPEGASVLLPVKQAYKEDIKYAKQNRFKLKDILFVSSNVATMINGGNQVDIWVDKKPRKCAIGSDPEIAFFCDGDIIYAGDYVPFGNRIGSDGPLLEIRPDPGGNAKEHVENIRSIMNELPDAMKVLRKNFEVVRKKYEIELRI